MSRPRLARTVEAPPSTVHVGSGDVLAPKTKPQVFISHDSRDAELAEAFSNLLTDASGGTLKSFRSSDRKGTAGIEFGAEWYKSIMDTLASATDVVALLTQNSINRPWILYEVGVAKGKLNSTAFGVALGVPLEKASTGPFAQFQNSDSEEDSLTKLVLQLIRRNPDADPREEAVRRQVQAFRQQLAQLVAQAAKPAGPAAPAAKVDETAVAKLFEEVKVLFRDLPDQVEGKLKHARRVGGRRHRRLHPMLVEEILFRRSAELPGSDAASWLMFISILRDDAPWLYEAGLPVYHALHAKDGATLTSATKGFMSILELSARQRRVLHELYDGDDDFLMLVRHLPEMVTPFIQRVEARRLETLAEHPEEESRKSRLASKKTKSTEDA